MGWGDVHSFFTTGSWLLSTSEHITSVGKMRGGLGFVAEAGGHFRLKFLTIG